jgi:phospholipase/carboxylesterase
MGLPITRRVLILAMATGLVACRGGGQRESGSASAAATSGAPSGGPSPSDWGGLEVARFGFMGEEERGGVAVVLLHGWGASGDDLVPLARELGRPGTRFFVPAAPLAETGGGRAWWHLDASRPATATDGELPAGHQPNHQLGVVRSSVQAILRTIRSRYAPNTLVLGGFSQGAMLSLDVALAADPPVDRVVVMSGSLLADSLEGLRTAQGGRPPVFVSHGRSDGMLPFQGAERAKDTLERHGFAVTWHPFEGGHQIPRSVVEHVREFMFGGTN